MDEVNKVVDICLLHQVASNRITTYFGLHQTEFVINVLPVSHFHFLLVVVLYLVFRMIGACLVHTCVQLYHPTTYPVQVRVLHVLLRNQIALLCKGQHMIDCPGTMSCYKKPCILARSALKFLTMTEFCSRLLKVTSLFDMVTN